MNKLIISIFIMSCSIEAYTETPLYKAARDGDLKLVNDLLLHGHPVNERNGAQKNEHCTSYSKGQPGYGLSPLYGAIYSHKIETVLQLIKMGADVNLEGNVYGDSSPLVAAERHGTIEITHLLIQRGAVAGFDTVLHIVAKRKDQNRLRLLLSTRKRMEEKGLIDPSTTLISELFTTVIASITATNCISLLEYLIQLGADVNYSTISYAGPEEPYFQKPIHALCQAFTPQIARARLPALYLLINHGAELTARNGLGQTALDIAKNYTAQPLIDVLEKKR